MGFSPPPQPPPFIPPAPPAPPTPMTAATSTKPPQKPQQPTFVSQALMPGPASTGPRSLIGGAPTALGA